MKMKSFAMAKPILIICLFLASEIVQATQDKASIQPETGQLDHANCDQPEFNNRPVLMAKRSYPPRPSAVELTYLKGFSTIHDITKSFTIRIRCSANYNVTIDAHNLILGMNHNLTIDNSSSDLTLVDKYNVEPEIIGEGNYASENFRVSKIVEITLFKKLGKYLVICSATECASEKVKSGLAIDYSPTTLRVFPMELHNGAKIHKAIEWNKTILVTSVTATFFIILVAFGASVAYIQYQENRRRIIREIEARERRASQIPLSEFRSSIIPETSTSFTSGLLGQSSSFIASGMEETEHETHAKYM